MTLNGTNMKVFSGGAVRNLSDIGTVGGGWTDDGTVVRLTTITDKVGIGTASPDSRVHIMESDASAGPAAVTAPLTVERNGNCFIQFLTPNLNIVGLYFGDPQSTSSGQLIYDHNTNELTFHVNSLDRWKIISSGQLVLLTSTAGIRPDADNQGNLGSAGIAWQNAHIRTLNLENVGIVPSTNGQLRLVTPHIVAYSNSVARYLSDISARAARTSTQALAPPGGTWYDVLFATEVYDTDIIRNATFPERFTCKTAGRYLVYANIGWVNTEFNQGTREARIVDQAGTVLAHHIAYSASNFQITNTLFFILQMAVNDWVKIQAMHDVGTTLNLGTGINRVYAGIAMI